jgi:magnesium chelatase family protein
MFARVTTVAFEGIEARGVDVQVQIGPGLPAFTIVGLADKAVAESRERVRGALNAIGLALPPKRITVNLAPADLPKEGSHYDLPIALGLMAAVGAIARDAIGANALGKGLICPAACGAEAAWAAEDMSILAPSDLLVLVNHFKGLQTLRRPQPTPDLDDTAMPDLRDIKGQETAKRALEVAAAGGHNLLMIGPPGAGKSMLARRLPSLLPPLEPAEMLEVSMIRSLAGDLNGGRIGRARPFRSPHHSASMAALVGGGTRPRPGEVALAHLGVLFLDELPEFHPQVLDALRQPLETGETVIAGQSPHHLSVAHSARGGGEPVPVRARGRAGLRLPAGQRLRRALSGPHLRSTARPYRSPDRSTRRLCRGSGVAASRGRQRRGEEPCRRRAAYSGRALCRPRPPACPHQCRM